MEAIGAAKNKSYMEVSYDVKGIHTVVVFPRILVQKINHRWRSPLVQKEELSRPVIKGWVGKTFHFPLLYFLASLTSPFPAPCPPVVPTPVPAPSNPEGDLMIFD